LDEIGKTEQALIQYAQGLRLKDDDPVVNMEFEQLLAKLRNRKYREIEDNCSSQSFRI
jgi:hypothetical protein